MRSALLFSVLLAGLLAVVAKAPQDVGIIKDALVADEECPMGASPGCALHALQLRAQTTAQTTAAADEHSPAQEAAGATATAPEAGPAEEAEEPEAFVELDEEELEEAWTPRRRSYSSSSRSRSSSASSRSRYGTSASAYSASSSMSRRRRSSSGGRNRCCKCNDNAVSWSQTGKCSHCQQSGIFKSVKPPAKCQQGSSSWRGKKNGKKGDPSWPRHCAKECSTLLKSYRPPVHGGSGSGSYHPGTSGSINNPGLNSGYNPSHAGSSNQFGGSSGAGCKESTGGSCRFMGCSKSRNAKCVKGKCVCQNGACASKGKCMVR